MYELFIAQYINEKIWRAPICESFIWALYYERKMQEQGVRARHLAQSIQFSVAADLERITDTLKSKSTALAVSMKKKQVLR